MKDANRKALNKLLGVGVLCFVLSACGAPWEKLEYQKGVVGEGSLYYLPLSSR